MTRIVRIIRIPNKKRLGCFIRDVNTGEVVSPLISTYRAALGIVERSSYILEPDYQPVKWNGKGRVCLRY